MQCVIVLYPLKPCKVSHTILTVKFQEIQPGLLASVLPSPPPAPPASPPACPPEKKLLYRWCRRRTRWGKVHLPHLLLLMQVNLEIAKHILWPTWNSGPGRKWTWPGGSSILNWAACNLCGKYLHFIVIIIIHMNQEVGHFVEVIHAYKIDTKDISFDTWSPPHQNTLPPWNLHIIQF